MDPILSRKVHRSARKLGLSVSDLVELALKTEKAGGIGMKEVNVDD
jgi:hypothetical protein